LLLSSAFIFPPCGLRTGQVTSNVVVEAMRGTPFLVVDGATRADAPGLVVASDQLLTSLLFWCYY
jgi:hypothetical protein